MFLFYALRLNIATLLAAIGLVLAVPAAHAQAPVWQLVAPAYQAGSTIPSVAATATDAQGNVFVVGQFSNTITFGATTLTSVGGFDGFVAKWSPVTRSYMWVQQVGSAFNDIVNGVAVNGNRVYVAGQFSGTVSLGTTVLTNSVNTSSDGFVAELTDAGGSSSFGWAQQLGGDFPDTALALAMQTTSQGTSVYVAGSFSGTSARFGPFTLVNAANTTTDVFVTKLVEVGTTVRFEWAQRAGGPDGDAAQVLAVRGNSVYIAGAYGLTNSPNNSPAGFGSTVLTPAGTSDGFVARLTDAGTSAGFDWAVSAGGPGADGIYGLALSGTSIYISGQFFGASLTLGSLVLPTAGSFDGFVAKLTEAGPSAGFIWANRLGGAGSDGASQLAVRGSSVYVVGTFASMPASFGSLFLSSTNSLFDVFVTKLTDAGPTSSFAWVQSAGGTGLDYGRSVLLSGHTVYVSGMITPPAVFAPLAANGPANSTAIFLAGLDDPTLTATTPAAAWAESLRVLPNPAHGTATVSLPAGTGSGSATLTVLDALGRSVSTRTVPLLPAGGTAELDLSRLAAGVYAVQMTAGAATATRKLVVE